MFPFLNVFVIYNSPAWKGWRWREDYIAQYYINRTSICIPPTHHIYTECINNFLGTNRTIQELLQNYFISFVYASTKLLLCQHRRNPYVYHIPTSNNTQFCNELKLNKNIYIFGLMHILFRLKLFVSSGTFCWLQYK